MAPPSDPSASVIRSVLRCASRKVAHQSAPRPVANTVTSLTSTTWRLIAVSCRGWWPVRGAPWCRAYPRGCGGAGWPTSLGLALVVFARGGAGGVGCFCGQVCGGDAGVGPVVVEPPREELVGLGDERVVSAGRHVSDGDFRIPRGERGPHRLTGGVGRGGEPGTPRFDLLDHRHDHLGDLRRRGVLGHGNRPGVVAVGADVELAGVGERFAVARCLEPARPGGDRPAWVAVAIGT